MACQRDLKSAHEPEAPVYEHDLVAWAFANARLLREGRFDSLDVENIAEELESAIDETGLPSSSFPPRCPYRQDELLSSTFWP